MALRKEFLRQHYLDQVHGSAALPRDTLSLRNRRTPTAGWLPGDTQESRSNDYLGQAPDRNEQVDVMGSQCDPQQPKGNLPNAPGLLIVFW
jgi:hypothetical protein